MAPPSLFCKISCYACSGAGVGHVSACKAQVHNRPWQQHRRHKHILWLAAKRHLMQSQRHASRPGMLLCARLLTHSTLTHYGLASKCLSCCACQIRFTGPGCLDHMHKLGLTADLAADSLRGVQRPRWQPGRAPALYAYNDAMFSPHDFQAISRIGQDSKLGKPAATGAPAPPCFA